MCINSVENIDFNYCIIQEALSSLVRQQQTINLFFIVTFVLLRHIIYTEHFLQHSFE